MHVSLKKSRPSLMFDVFDVNLQQRQKAGTVTKRTILSTAVSFFDPLGFMSQVLLIPKIKHRLCRDFLDWDDREPDELEQKWKTWLEKMPHLS